MNKEIQRWNAQTGKGRTFKMLQFAIREHKLIRNGNIVYKKNEYSFDFLPHQQVDFDLLIEDLYLSFNEKEGLNCACQIWGYHPHTTWVNKTLTLPPFVEGSLILLNDRKEEDEITRLVEIGEWKTYFDQETKWVCIGSDLINANSKGVEFAPGIIAITEHHSLKSIWIRPSGV